MRFREPSTPALEDCHLEDAAIASPCGSPVTMVFSRAKVLSFRFYSNTGDTDLLDSCPSIGKFKSQLGSGRQIVKILADRSAEWLPPQTRSPGYHRLSTTIDARACGGTGRRSGLKIRRGKTHVGSSPTRPIIHPFSTTDTKLSRLLRSSPPASVPARTEPSDL